MIQRHIGGSPCGAFLKKFGVVRILLGKPVAAAFKAVDTPPFPRPRSAGPQGKIITSVRIRQMPSAIL